MGAEMALRVAAVLLGVVSAAASPKNVLYMIVDVRRPLSPPHPTPTPAAAYTAAEPGRGVLQDLRPSFNESYGQHQMSTPNIDRLSRKGVTFTRAYCQQARPLVPAPPLSSAVGSSGSRASAARRCVQRPATAS